MAKRILLVAARALPIAIPAGWSRPLVDGQAYWLLGLFCVSVGLPFFAFRAHFFGVLRIINSPKEGVRRLQHGTSLHGATHLSIRTAQARGRYL